MNDLRQKKSIGARMLDTVERVGNKLPHPFMLFLYLAIAVILFSWLISSLGVSFVHPGTGEETSVQSLVSTEGFMYILDSMISNFIGFTPLGLVLTMMLGIGLAQQVGLVETFIKSTILKAPTKLVTIAVVTTGIVGNIASDAAFVLVPPLGAMIFYAIGRHPLAGMAAGFAGVGAGFTANFLPAGTDVLLSGISTEVVQTIEPGFIVHMTDNYYFMIASSVMLIIICTLVTEKIIEPRLGKFNPKYGEKEFVNQELERVGRKETKALLISLLAGFIYLAVVSLFVVPVNGILRGEGGTIVPSPFISNIVPIILFLFLTVSIAYGVAAGVIKSTRDIPEMMAEAIKSMAGYIVLIFAAAQFIAYFGWSNIGVWIAVSGAEFLESINMTGISVIVGFIFLTTLLNLFIFSGSAQWALMAPVFIPMFMLLDYHPALVQLAYRIGDSSTSVITPMNPYVPMVLAFMKKYDSRAGFGTLFSIMLPYTLFVLALWIVLFLIWTGFELPIGPGVTDYKG
ncbi:aminobenzoyl-glutamate transport protein [Alkalihalobacillus xiaoxiensis]|uniref:Aminobenzoyl-glutamate transport protein n=1 Tax=Shouchella xiaoxiensis TaxID=766895 RepID=A0ABS2SY55_9BACI|nr:AbgT family transporter [Shouchella xiaoxiensis]MBM7839364.1 aminobenzoyl-glutamate transport protein [Shouchella xiaoxiensis]